MCYIDLQTTYDTALQKTYDTVDHPLPWQVLTRIGVPPQMTAVIRQIHDGMRVCVAPDDGVCSEWFEVEQGLRQGCVVSPLLLIKHLRYTEGVKSLEEMLCRIYQY